MKEKELIDIWKKEESVAHIHGWDFSHIEGRYTEETDLPWNYQHIILDYLRSSCTAKFYFVIFVCLAGSVKNEFLTEP